MHFQLFPRSQTTMEEKVEDNVSIALHLDYYLLSHENHHNSASNKLSAGSKAPK